MIGKESSALGCPSLCQLCLDSTLASTATLQLNASPSPSSLCYPTKQQHHLSSSSFTPSHSISPLRNPKDGSRATMHSAARASKGVNNRGKSSNQHHLSFLSSCSSVSPSHSIWPLTIPEDGSRASIYAAARGSKGNDKRGKSSKQLKTGHGSSGKPKNPWVEGSSISPRHKSSSKNKANAWNDNGKQGGSFSKGKAEDKRSPNGGMSSVGEVFVSGMMPIKEEELLQPYETVVSPSWITFVSSNAGIWQGVAAAFSPFTAELEPITISANKEVCECKTWNIAKPVRPPETSKSDVVYRKVLWNPETSNVGGKMGVHSTLQEDYQILEAVESSDGLEMNIGGMFPEIASEKLHDEYNVQETLMNMDAPLGYGHGNAESETKQHQGSSSADHRSCENSPAMVTNESDNDAFHTTDDLDVMEEDYMALEAGLVFFEDGSYSRGPLQLLEKTPETFIVPQPSVFKIEQCLVRGGHTRLRVVHTIEIQEGGAAVQVLRLIVFEEEWKGPSNWTHISATGATLPCFAQRKRLKQNELKGRWKVFEIDVSVIYETDAKDGLPITNVSLQHFCKEEQISRQLPSTDPLLETDNSSVLWLLGGVYTYMDVTADSMLIVGIGWLGKDSTNLVIERLYGPDGNLAEVRSKSEIAVG